MRVKRGLAALALLLASAAAGAAALDQLDRFLETTRSYRAEFSQRVVAKGGRKPQISAGTLAILRPGKLRWEVLRPYPQLVVGDGERFWIYDPELRQVTVRKAGEAIGSSPAALLSGSEDLRKNFALAEAGEADGLEWAEARPRAADSGFERLRLGFSGGELKAMELHDQFGQVTTVEFTRVERNPKLAPSLFRFVPPSGADVVGE
ncbi:MAG: outer membrane lipoprotein chaperone LolA [Betaproteobacteria bacterium]|nr:outer membrane lipoprotein chaperone LolA [Betaproteobacteria bacterium]MBK8917534.1 outer membrane lipoprotein chaperone LolA [Betaproteobacteria bacterium]